MSTPERDLTRKVAHARKPATVAADIIEIEGILERIALRYPKDYDAAFLPGGSGSDVGSRGNLHFVNPTQDAATSIAKDLQRHRVARAGGRIRQALKLLREVDADLAPPRRKGEYVEVWLPSSSDPVVTDEELGTQLRKQRERARRGEM